MIQSYLRFKRYANFDAVKMTYILIKYPALLRMTSSNSFQWSLKYFLIAWLGKLLMCKEFDY